MNVPRHWFLIILVVSIPQLSFAEEVFTFKGQIDFSRSELNIILDFNDQSSVAATAKKISETGYQLLLDIKHLKTPLFDLISKMGSSVEIISKKNHSKLPLADSIYRGSVWSQYSLIDYKPVQELSGNFEIKGQRLQLTELSFGGLLCNGYIDLVQPYALDMVVNLSNIGMKKFLNFWGASKKYDSSGTVSGEIKASGTLKDLALKGNLEGREGFVSKLNFDIISLNIEGTYPHMQIAQSTISKSDGVSFTLDGPINLSDKANFKKQIKALTLAPLVSDTGLVREWTIKRRNLEESGMTEIKYRFRKGDALGIGTSVEDEADMFGFERTRKF